MYTYVHLAYLYGTFKAYNGITRCCDVAVGTPGSNRYNPGLNHLAAVSKLWQFSSPHVAEYGYVNKRSAQPQRLDTALCKSVPFYLYKTWSGWNDFATHGLVHRASS